jgi:AI-2 transport protein TqsA
MMLTENKAITISVLAVPLLALVAMTAMCYFAAPILVPLVTAMTLAYVLWPLVSLLRKIKVPHVPAVIIVMLCFILLLLVFGMIIYGEAKEFAAKLPGYWNQFQELRTKWMDDYPLLGETLLQKQGESLLNQIDISNFAMVPKYLLKGIGGVVSFSGQAILILLLTLFMLIEQKGLTARLRRALGGESEGASGHLIQEISKQLAGYIWVRALTTFGLAVVFTLGLVIGGVDYPYIWGPLAALLNLIPYVGAFIGAIPPMIMAAVQASSFLPMLWVFVFFMVVQFFE